MTPKTRTNVQAASHACVLKVTGLVGTKSPNLTLVGEDNIALTIPRMLLGRMGADVRVDEVLFLTFGFTRVTTEPAIEPLLPPGAH